MKRCVCLLSLFLLALPACDSGGSAKDDKGSSASGDGSAGDKDAGDENAQDEDGESGDEAGGKDGDADGNSENSENADTDADDDEGGTGEEGVEGGAQFVQNDNIVESTCDIWSQDCDEGEKCTAVITDGSGAWNSNQCVPLVEDGGKEGDECTFTSGAAAGDDNCDLGMMCWNTDMETGVGTCVSFCTGSADAPSCSDGAICSIYNNGVLPLCLPPCDPLTPGECPGDDLCVISANGDGFVCVLNAGMPDVAFGDVCQFVNVCQQGGICVGAENFTACDGGGCCSDVCDLASEENTCTNDPAQMCIPVFEEGSVGPDFQDIGFCGIPQ